MADMCGPSNALSNFQKHSTVDRTLQQDRLISRQSPSQGFRSAPGPNARHLDPEFEAFQAGNLPLDAGFQHPAGFPQRNVQAGPANWASDFQRMNISGPPLQQFQQPGLESQMQQGQSTGAWHQDFARQQNQIPASNPALQQSNMIQRFPMMSGGQDMSMWAPQGGFMEHPQQMQAAHQQEIEHFDDAAFARAFDEAEKAERGAQEQQGLELGQDIMINESAERLMSSSPDLSAPLDQAPIGADTIHDQNHPQEQQQQDDPDALARTARRLLDSVADDQSDKMKGSMFMELMRQFRDGDATVKGDEVVSRVNGQDPSTDRGNGDMKTTTREISAICYNLKRTLLDRDRPFQRSSIAVRNLILDLIQLDQLLRSPTLTASSKEEIAHGRGTRVGKTLAAVVSSPSLNGIPSVRLLAIHCLNNVDKVSDFEGTQDAADILAANRELTFSKPTGLAVNGNGDDSDEQTADTHLTFQRECLSRALAAEDPFQREALSYLLGYDIVPDTSLPGSTTTGGTKEVHLQRARDILGPSLSRVIDVLMERGFFCPEITHYQVTGLAEALDTEGKGKNGAHFVNEVRAVERSVEERLGMFLGRFFGAEGAIGNGELEVVDAADAGDVERAQGELLSSFVNHTDTAKFHGWEPLEGCYGITRAVVEENCFANLMEFF